MADPFKNLQAQARRRGFSLHKGPALAPFTLHEREITAENGGGTIHQDLDGVRTMLATRPPDGFAGPYKFSGADRAKLAR